MQAYGANGEILHTGKQEVHQSNDQKQGLVIGVCQALGAGGMVYGGGHRGHERWQAFS